MRPPVPPPTPRRGITLLEAGLAAALLLGAGGFAAWRATPPGRLLKELQGRLASGSGKDRVATAREILLRCARDGMTEEQVRKLYEPLPLDGTAPGEAAESYLLGGIPGPRAELAGECDFVFERGQLVRERCYVGYPRDP